MAWMGVASLGDEVIGGESYTAVGAMTDVLKLLKTSD